MCGRYALVLAGGVLELPFVEESEFPALELPWASYNVCPGTQAPILDKDSMLRPALWGLIPHWSKEPPKRPLFNARLETAATRSSFRTAWESQRCAVPTSGFYEWSDSKGARLPYFIPPEDGDAPLWLAGLASRWTSPEGEKRWTYSVLTESSEGSPVARLHDRRPVALRPDSVAEWLEGGKGPAPANRAALGQPYRVSPRMNAAAINEPENLVPIESEAGGT